MDSNGTARYANYLPLCQSTGLGPSNAQTDRAIDAALFSWSAREALLAQRYKDRQHGLLGHVSTSDGEEELVLLNTSHPWSTFICGSQGSGKSYTTSCLLENCLTKHNEIGTLQNPMAGMLFRYDRYGSGLCEAATLCTGSGGVKVQILLSPFNFKTMEKKYRNFVPAGNTNLEIKPFYLKSRHLNAERMQKFMASGDGEKPLYMNVSVICSH
jgi:hypothetical protein